MKKKQPGKYTARQQLQWVWSRLGRYKYGIFLITVLQMGSSFNAMVLPLVFKMLVDAITTGQGRPFLHYFILYIVLFEVQTTIWSVLYYLNQRVGFQTATSLRSSMYEGLLRTEYSSLKEYAAGELNSRLNGDVSTVAGILWMIPDVLSMIVKMVGVALILFAWEPIFLGLYIVVVAVIGAAMILLRRPMKEMRRAILRQSDGVQAVQQDTLNNTLMVQTFLAYHSAVAAWKDRVDGLRREVYRQNRFSNVLHTGYEVATDVGYLFCLLWFGAKVLNGQLSYGTLAAALQLVGQVQNPFGDIAQQFSSWFSFQTSAERLMDLDALPKESFQPETPLPDMEAIEIRDLSFSYDDSAKDEDPTLKNVSLDIHRGDCIGFVGVSGAGKSTMLKILLALYSVQTGRVTIRDRQGGTEPLSPATRRLFAYVPQGHNVMAGTIRQVVSFRYDKTDFTQEEKDRIQDACRVACADEFIRDLPGGYESQIGEGGAGVSEGQLQRLAIARAIYYGAPVLLLDEATSALDEVTERHVLENIRALQDRTVLTVTHNAQALSICNRIVRIKDGVLHEESPDEAAARAGI